MMSLSAPVPLVALPARRPNQTEPNASAHQSEASELRLRRPRRRQLGRVWAGNWRASSSKLGRFAAGALLAGGAGRRLASEQTSGLTKAGFLTATDHVKCRTSKLRAQKAAIGNLARASDRAKATRDSLGSLLAPTGSLIIVLPLLVPPPPIGRLSCLPEPEPEARRRRPEAGGKGGPPSASWPSTMAPLPRGPDQQSGHRLHLHSSACNASQAAPAAPLAAPAAKPATGAESGAPQRGSSKFPWAAPGG